ncbi:hypothetical protein BDR26DRAFT_870007 [Obelidium mucronatum]|nr:hypothetical protein BDR26DRAFT_870007 [Obelidium mucronatum]
MLETQMDAVWKDLATVREKLNNPETYWELVSPVGKALFKHDILLWATDLQQKEAALQQKEAALQQEKVLHLQIQLEKEKNIGRTAGLSSTEMILRDEQGAKTKAFETLESQVLELKKTVSSFLQKAETVQISNLKIEMLENDGFVCKAESVLSVQNVGFSLPDSFIWPVPNKEHDSTPVTHS